jgi:hypothetical protein
VPYRVELRATLLIDAPDETLAENEAARIIDDGCTPDTVVEEVSVSRVEQVD